MIVRCGCSFWKCQHRPKSVGHSWISMHSKLQQSSISILMPVKESKKGLAVSLDMTTYGDNEILTSSKIAP